MVVCRRLVQLWGLAGHSAVTTARAAAGAVGAVERVLPTRPNVEGKGSGYDPKGGKRDQLRPRLGDREEILPDCRNGGGRRQGEVGFFAGSQEDVKPARPADACLTSDQEGDRIGSSYRPDVGILGSQNPPTSTTSKMRRKPSWSRTGGLRLA